MGDNPHQETYIANIYLKIKMLPTKYVSKIKSTGFHLALFSILFSHYYVTTTKLAASDVRLQYKGFVCHYPTRVPNRNDFMQVVCISLSPDDLLSV